MGRTNLKLEIHQIQTHEKKSISKSKIELVNLPKNKFEHSKMNVNPITVGGGGGSYIWPPVLFS